MSKIIKFMVVTFSILLFIVLVLFLIVLIKYKFNFKEVFSIGTSNKLLLEKEIDDVSKISIDFDIWGRRQYH